MQAPVGKELDHLKGGGAAIDNDGLAILAQGDGGLGDGALALDIQGAADVEGARRQQRAMVGIDCLDPAMHPTKLAHRCQFG